MFDPVWLGNYIVPRWEAFGIVGVGIVILLLVGLAIFYFGAVWIVRQLFG